MNLVARGLLETHAIFMLALESDFGWSRTDVSGIYSIALLTFGFTGPLVGWLLDRLGPPRVYALGLFLIVSAFSFSSHSHQLWQLALSQGLMLGFGIACLSSVSLTTLLSRWFQRFLSTAMAFAYASMGIGVMIFSPFAEKLNSMLGWRDSYLVMTLLALACIPFVGILFRLRAAEGNPVLKRRAEEQRIPLSSVKCISVVQALKSIEFWGLAWVYFVTGIGSFTVLLQTPAYMIQLGYSPAFAAGVYGAIGFLSPAGIIGITLLSQRFGRTPTILVSYAMSILGVVCLLGFDYTASLLLLGLFVLFYGGTFGCRAPAIGALAAGCFNGPSLGRIYGLITVFSGIGASAGAYLGGWFYETTGQYQLGALFAIGMFLLGNLPFWTVPGLAGRQPQTR